MTAAAAAPAALAGERPALTGLRALAAMWVLLFHLQIRAPLAEGPAARVIEAGAGGMTLFFALSAFVLGLAYRGPVAPGAFARARLARLYPLYLAAALATVPWLFVHGLDAGGVVVTVLLSVLMLQAWLPQTFALWNHPASWSLSVEAAFYALFPALRAALAPLAAPALMAAILGCVALSALFAAAHHLLPGGPGFAHAYATPLFRLPEFVAGLAAARLALAGHGVGAGAAATAAALTLAALAVAGGAGSPMLWTPLLLPPVLMVLVALARVEGGALCAAPVRWAGRASYAIYLAQTPVILGLPPLAARLGVELSAPAYWTAAIVLTLLLAALAHHGLERPARAALMRRRTPRAAPPPGLPA